MRLRISKIRALAYAIALLAIALLVQTSLPSASFCAGFLGLVGGCFLTTWYLKHRRDVRLARPSIAPGTPLKRVAPAPKTHPESSRFDLPELD